MTLRLSGNVWIASGDNVAAFGETEELAIQRFEQLREADQREHQNGKPHETRYDVPDRRPGKRERKRQRRRYQKTRRYAYGI